MTEKPDLDDSYAMSDYIGPMVKQGSDVML